MARPAKRLELKISGQGKRKRKKFIGGIATFYMYV